jgi:hypothetical protein
MHEDTASARALRALRAADQTHQGRVSGGMGAEATERLAALDACAETIRAWSPLLIPGLLQTSRYAAGAIKARTPSLPAESVNKRVRARWDRNEAFLDRWGQTAVGGQAWFLVGESAITRPVINEHAHANQLTYLMQLSATMGHVQVQIVPDHAVYGVEPFSVHALENGARVGHTETLIGGWYTTLPEDISRLYAAFSTLMDQALTPADSRRLIGEVLYSCWGPTTEPSTASPPTATPTTASTSPALPPAPSE